jgi:hypothetical protein
VYEHCKAALKQSVRQVDADPDWKQKFINGEVEFGNNYSQRKRLKDLLQGLDPSLRDLFTLDVRGLVDRIVSTRNSLTHTGENPPASVLQGTDLTWGFYKLQILLGVLVLREVGLSDAELVRVLSNNARMMNILDQARHI